MYVGVTRAEDTLHLSYAEHKTAAPSSDAPPAGSFTAECYHPGPGNSGQRGCDSRLVAVRITLVRVVLIRVTVIGVFGILVGALLAVGRFLVWMLLLI